MRSTSCDHEPYHHRRGCHKGGGVYPQFAQAHPEVPWRSMRGMRNRIAHGYFDINLEVVWETVQSALPKLLEQLPEVHRDAE